MYFSLGMLQLDVEVLSYTYSYGTFFLPESVYASVN